MPISTTAPSAEPLVVDAAPPVGQTITLTGRDFMNEEFTQDSLVAPTVLSLKHFGGVSAKLEVPVAVSEVSISLRSRSVSDALPIIALAVGNGTTTHSVLRGETISRDYEATKPLAIGAGRYDVIIEYSYATDSEQRPALDIHQLEFR